MEKNVAKISNSVKRDIDLAGFTRQKRGSEILAFTVEKTDLDHKAKLAYDLRRCGKQLVFGEDPEGGSVLLAAYFCQKRL